ncbi:unnamed protein product [Echinostoma caproni]|uniref:GpcrRhopsn4 domain-containing protein n=1 Tax=Echinostoma caproni TaxID=27848 RepID=A0A183ABZ3_9TREM|nr:unnamed protein product [Echinostoma caproni]
MRLRCYWDSPIAWVDSYHMRVTPSPVIMRTPVLSGVEMAYQITLRNGLSGDFFREHFSAEKFGNLEMDMVFFLFVSVLLFFAVIIASQLLYSTSTSALFSGLLLLSSGYTVVHRLLSRTLVIVLYIFLGTYILVNAATQISMVLLETRGDVLSRYHSKAGYVFVSLQLIAWAGFCVSCGYTLFSWSQKRLFFIRLAAIFSLWFWNIPLWTFVTIGVTHKRFTENLIRVWDELITLGAYILLMLILRPENTNTVFPFHLSHPEGTSREAIVPPQKPTKTEKTLPSLLAPIRSTESPVLSRSRPRTPETPQTTKSPGKALSPRKPLPGIGGKPGDTPGPGFTLSHNLAEIAATDGHWPNRPRTTPSMNTTQVKLEPKHVSAS